MIMLTTSEFKIVGMIFGAVFAASVINGWHGASTVTAELREGARSALDQELSDRGELFRAKLKHYEQEIGGLARLGTLASLTAAHSAGGINPQNKLSLSQSRSLLEQDLAGVLAADSGLIALSVLDAEGQELVRLRRGQGPTPAGSLGKRKDVLAAASFTDGKSHLSPVRLRRENGKPLSPASPYVEFSIGQGDGKQAVIVIAELTPQAFLSALVPSTKTQAVYLVDGAGQFLIHPDPKKLWGKELAEPNLAAQLLPNLAKALTKASSGRLELSGLRHAYGKLPLPKGCSGIAWTQVRSLRPELGGILPRLSSLFVLILSLALTGIPCLLLVRNQFTQPLSLSVKDLVRSAQELAMVSQQMSASAQQTSAQAVVVSAAADEVSQNGQMVATGVEQMRASVSEVARSASEAAVVATTAVDVAEKTNNTVTNLGESSTEIGKIIKTITAIAEQTNMLALNATIEAARAGKAGKGFAVVANEVKELAKQTTGAADDISRKIEAIQTDSGDAVRAIGEISSIILNINDIQNTIASAVEEQAATTSEISRAVKEAARGSAEIAQNMSSVAQAAESTSTGAHATQDAASDLANIAIDLQTVIGRVD